MSMPPTNDFNPYASPALDPAAQKTHIANHGMQAKVKQFRDQMHALGAFWIILGVLAIGAMLVLASTMEASLPEMAVLLVILGGVGGVWLLLGVLTCMKIMPAVYVGLVLSYISLIGNILRFNLCGLLMMGAGILQAHRVIGLSKEMRAAGIPLTARPQDIQTPVQAPPGFFN